MRLRYSKILVYLIIISAIILALVFAFIEPAAF